MASADRSAFGSYKRDADAALLGKVEGLILMPAAGEHDEGVADGVADAVAAGAADGAPPTGGEAMQTLDLWWRLDNVGQAWWALPLLAGTVFVGQSDDGDSFVYQTSYRQPGAVLRIPGGVVHSTAPTEEEERTALLQQMLAYEAPALPRCAERCMVTEVALLEDVVVERLRETGERLLADVDIDCFHFTSIHSAVDYGFKKKVRVGDAIGFERYGNMLRGHLEGVLNFGASFEEAHVLRQGNASARFGAHVDKMQGDDDAHPVGHALVIDLGKGMKLAVFFVGSRQRKAPTRYQP